MSKKRELRKLKYSYVRNYTLNAELSAKARDWSFKRIEKELGLAKIEKRPRLRPIPKRVNTYLDRTADYRAYLTKNNKLQDYRFSVKQSKMQRMATWTRFSEDDQKEMPKELEQLSKDINKSKNYKQDDSYGFAVVFYSFIEDKSFKFIEERMTRDKFDGDIYLFNEKA
jgi:uncharacterized FlaG/YvyC family protein|tara:strand:- start:2529 stop:3035 length:507 start_codon:yes stop_codon:yes gene_type:complete